MRWIFENVDQVKWRRCNEFLADVVDHENTDRGYDFVRPDRSQNNKFAQIIQYHICFWGILPFLGIQRKSHFLVLSEIIHKMFHKALKARQLAGTA